VDLGLLAAVEREVLGWAGVETERSRFFGGDVTIYKVGRRQLGYVHHAGVADLQVPQAIHDELIAAGRAVPHGAGFAAVVSAPLERQDDVANLVALFRLGYDRAIAAGERRRRREGG